MNRSLVATGLPAVVVALSISCAGGGAASDTRPVSARAQAQAQAQTQPEAAPPGFQIHVEEQPGRDRWRIEYRLATPVMGLRFVRNRNRYRAARWSIAGPAAWTERDGHEEIVLAAPSTVIAVEFDTMFDHVPKDYELNRAFSDGSRLLYTGQLMAQPLVCPTAAPCAATETRPVEHLSHGWELRTARGRWIRLLDRAGDGALSWAEQDQSGDGTYVYFGSSQPLEDERFSAIIDPGLPAWMLGAARELLPRLFDHYTRELGAKLPRRPLLLLSFGGFERPGRSSGGGVLGGVLQISAEGEGFRESSPDLALRWRHLLAHEVFHLWNGSSSWVDLGAHEEWLAEGTADYSAYRALFDLGVMDEAAFRREVIHAANRCVARLAGRPLLAAPLRFDIFYPCGMTLVAWADGAARRHGADIGDVMGRVFAAAARREQPSYSTYDFLEQLERITGEPLVTGPLERVLRIGVHEATGAFFAEQLGQAGFPVVAVEPRRATLPPYDFSLLLAAQLVRCDCASELPARIRSDAIEIAADPSCNAFRNGGRVTHVSGHAVASAPADAYQALLEVARPARPAALQSNGAALSLRCHAGAVDASFFELLRVAPDAPNDAP